MQSIMLLLLIGVCASFTLANEFEQAQKLFNEKRYTEAATTIENYLRSEPNDLEALLLAGDIYTELENPKRALEFYERAYQRNRDDARAIRAYSRALSNKGEHKQALEILQRALRANPKDVYLRIAYGQALLAADSIRAAELEITKAREMNRSIPDGYLALGDLYFNQRVYPLAKDNYEQALKLDPDNLSAHEKLALVYFRLANAEVVDNALANEYYSRSLQEWGEIIKRDSTYARAYFERGKIFFYASRYAEAAASLRTYIRLRPDAPNAALARWYCAQSLEKIGQCAEAEEFLRFAVEQIDSVRTKAQLLLARCYFDMKRYADAAALFGTLDTENPELISSTLDRERFGYSLVLSGDTLSAMRVLRHAVDKDSSRCVTIYRLGELYRNRQQYDDAIVMYERYLRNCGDTIAGKIFALIGAAHFSANRPQLAAEALRQSIRKDSTIVFAYRMLAASLRSSGAKVEDVLSVLRQGITFAKSASDRGLIYPYLCQLLLEEKRYEELKTAASQWLKSDPDRAEAALYNAVGYQGLGDRDSACKYYREALRLNPSLEIAKKNLKQLECK